MFLPSVLFTAVAVAPALVAANVNVYWGQYGDTTDRLRNYCDSPAVDYVTLSFVNLAPEHDATGVYPGTNFAGHCGAEVYYEVDGEESKLIKNCQTIKEDIPYCQSLGKKVLLAIGGEFNPPASDYSLSDDEAGVYFGQILVELFGPYKASYAGKPRPFDLDDETHVAVDGFDFDIEYKFADQQPWIRMIETIRADYPGVIITGAPQCPTASEWFQMEDIIAQAQFDALFIQFYNNPGCDATTSGFNYNGWVDVLATTEKSKDAKLFIGLSGSVGAAGSGYLTVSQAKSVICQYKDKAHFGGVSLWDATRAAGNVADGKTYYENLAEAFTDEGCASVTASVSTTATSTSSTATPTGTYCAKKHTVVAGEYCYLIAENNGLTLAQFLSYNPDVNCDLLQIGQIVCVETAVNNPITTTTTTTSTSSSATPTATYCTKTHSVVSGEYCYLIAENNDLTLDQFLSYNPGIDCSLLQIGQVVCVETGSQPSTSSTTTTASSTTSTTSSATPTATYCTKTHSVEPEEYCYLIAENNGLTLEQFLSYNPGLDCALLQIGQNVCVETGSQQSTSSTTSTTTTSTTSTTSSASSTSSSDSSTVSSTTSSISSDSSTSSSTSTTSTTSSSYVSSTTTTSTESSTSTSTSTSSSVSEGNTAATSSSSTYATSTSTTTTESTTSTESTTTTESTTSTESSTYTTSTESTTTTESATSTETTTSTESTTTTESTTSTESSLSTTSTTTSTESTTATESATSTESATTTESTTSTTSSASGHDESTTSTSSYEATSTTSTYTSSTTTEADEPKYTTVTEYSTSTICATVTRTTDGVVTTETIPLYTTVCPVTTTKALPHAPESTTSTVYTTKTYTITSCAAHVPSCHVGSVTTETIPLYTTVCPITSKTTKTTSVTVPKPTACPGGVPCEVNHVEEEPLSTSTSTRTAYVHTTLTIAASSIRPSNGTGPASYPYKPTYSSPCSGAGCPSGAASATGCLGAGCGSPTRPVATAGAARGMAVSIGGAVVVAAAFLV